MRQHFSSLVAAALMLGSMTAIQAQTATQLPASAATAAMTPKAQYDADLKQAKARLASDQKICNAEADSAARMQCKRDAQSEHDKAVAAAKAQLSASGQPVAAKPVCADCGKVVAVQQVEKKGEGSAVGLVSGAVVGGVLGHQIGGGTGKTLATVAGAAGGAYAGREVEKKVKSKKVWKVDVTFPDGHTSSYEFDNNPGYKVGDSVKHAGNSIARP
jgi:outer membrane lipoprotein SlyB